MNQLILFDDPLLRTRLLPLTFTRPVAALRCGIRTLAEKWEDFLAMSSVYQTENYLQARYPFSTSKGNFFYINGALCPDNELVAVITEMPAESVLFSDQNEILAVHTTREDWKPENGTHSFQSAIYSSAFTMIRHLWDLFLENGGQLKADFSRVTLGRVSAPVTDPHTVCYRPDLIFIEEGAQLKASIINAETGPVYIGKNAIVGEGTTIQGPFALLNDATLAQGAKIRPNTTVGPHCKVGGEVNNCIFLGFSNKGHDGYLGNSVLGEWCNLGANTNNSNLKNDFSNVKLHSYATGQLEDTGKTFCGLFMGDFSKAGISTMFNTGTVVGVNVNVFGAGFQPKHIPSFSWGGKAEGFSEYRLEKALIVAYETVKRKSIPFGETEKAILQHIFDQTTANSIIP